jgi:hypothetical protein
LLIVPRRGSGIADFGERGRHGPAYEYRHSFEFRPPSLRFPPNPFTFPEVFAQRPVVMELGEI